MLRSTQLCTAVSYSRLEHTNLFVRRSSTTSMPVSPPLSTAHLKRLTAAIEAQDGSQTLKELLPQLCASLPVGRAAAPSVDALYSSIRTVGERVKHRLEKQRKHEAAEAAAAAAPTTAANTRLRQRNSATAPRPSTATTSHSRTAKTAAETAHSRAEGRLVEALSALRERNVQHTEKRRAEATEAKRQRAVDRKAERAERLAKEAEEKREKRERTVKQREDEQELKESLRKQRTQQSLEAAAKKHEYESAQLAAQERARRLDEKMELVADLQIEVLRENLRRIRQKRAREESDEEDKENNDPNNDWQV